MTQPAQAKRLRVKRRLPRPSEILPLIGSADRSKNRIERRLARCGDVRDVREFASRRVPPAVFDYVDGAAGSERTLQRSRDVYARVEFTPRVLRDVADIDLTTTMLGQTSQLPFAFAPTGFTRMMQHVGEPAVARVAEQVGIPYALSTLGTTSVEDLAEQVPGCRRWFQLYVWRDRKASEALITRVREHGYEALMLTVDTAVGGIRLRDVRNGLTIPPQLTLRTLAQMAAYPRWWGNLLTTEPLAFASLKSTSGTVSELLTKVFDPSITADDIAWLRTVWDGPIILKGVQSVADAELAADLGVQAIVLSNHGGRQIDAGNVPLEILPAVLDRVGGRLEVYVDGGILCGPDILAAVGFGAQGVLVGRAYLYGLMAGGEAGVRRVATILEHEMRVTLSLLGQTSIDGIRGQQGELVRLRQPSVSPV
jgi:L-lactate dehydrogenase (cytochrome)